MGPLALPSKQDTHIIVRTADCTLSHWAMKDFWFVMINISLYVCIYAYVVFVVVIVQAFGNERDTGGPAVFRLAAKGVSAKSRLPWERDLHVDVIGFPKIYNDQRSCPVITNKSTYMDIYLHICCMVVANQVQDSGDGSYQLTFRPKPGINELCLFYRDDEDEQPVPNGQWMINVLKRACVVSCVSCVVCVVCRVLVTAR